MLQRVELAGGQVVYRSALLADCGAPHAFATRLGPGGAPLDAAREDPATEAALAAAAGAGAGPARLARARQVHGAEVRAVGADEPEPRVAADALVTARADRLLMVRTADCVPLLLARADGCAVSAVHAGWRGLLAGVIPRAVAALGEGALAAAIGPCLSLARFEVGPEVAAAFADAGLADCVHRRPGARPHVDLRAAAAAQLARAGVGAVEVSALCTWERADELYSYRRDVTHGGAPATGSLAALIAPARRGRPAEGRAGLGGPAPRPSG